MAAPVAAFVQLPTDSTGKKVQTQSEVIGSDTVHTYYNVERSPRQVTGRYYFTTDVLALAITGPKLVLLLMPTSTVWGRLRSLTFHFSTTGAVDTLGGVLLALEKMRFTGEPTAGTVAPASRRSSDSAAQTSLRLSTTGLDDIIGLGQAAVMLRPTLSVTSAGASWRKTEQLSVFDNDDFDEEFLLGYKPGELLRVNQVSGTATNQSFFITGSFEEYAPVECA